MKNLIIEMIDDNEGNIKDFLHKALQDGKKIMYSTHWRTTPVSEYNSSTLNIKIEPTNKELEYFDKQIYTLEEIIQGKKAVYKKGLEKMAIEKRIKAAERLTNQYTAADVIDYILS